MMSKQISKKAKQAPVQCVECNKSIDAKEQALFVEEEVGRYFCNEGCIVGHFTPEIEKLERQYGRHVAANDLSSTEREKYAHLRWMTLEEPGEVWLEKTTQGDHRHVLISEFKPDQKTVFAVAVCLMLRDEPSFLYLAFVTSDRFLVDVFRKGEKVRVLKDSEKPQIAPMKASSKKSNQSEEAKAEIEAIAEANFDNVHSIHGGAAGQHGFLAKAGALTNAAGLAEPWTEADSLHASILKNRKSTDIAIEDFGFYQKCLEETLQDPNELWSYSPKSSKKVYHFLKHYTHDQDYWYIVIAKDTVDETQIEIVDAFPTRDPALVQLCRHGRKENIGAPKSDATENAATEAQNDEMVPMAVGETSAPAAKRSKRNMH